MTRVTAPSRLHFGLFHVPGISSEHGSASPVRNYGGVGVMIDQPGTVVTVRPAKSWQVEGPLASRAQVFAQRFVTGFSECSQQPFQILIERAPSEHSGLGVGTQLGLAVATGLAREFDRSWLTTTEIAARIGRGERSAVGIHGFDRGGLILEAGKLPGESVAPLITRCELPAAWRVVLAIPSGMGRWSGERERQAFEHARSGTEHLRLAERLSRLACVGMLPAAREGDLEAFGEAVHEFNRMAGEPFASSQGGPYAGKLIEELIGDIRRMGVNGVGQSSWGPTVFAFTADEEEARTLALAVRSHRPDLQTLVTKPAHSGAKIESHVHTSQP